MDKNFFLKPQVPMQRRYEALRAYFVEELLVEDVAKRFSYSPHTVYSLLKQYKKLSSPEFFLELKRGPKEHREETLKVKNLIIALRKKNYMHILLTPVAVRCIVFMYGGLSQDFARVRGTFCH